MELMFLIKAAAGPVPSPCRERVPAIAPRDHASPEVSGLCKMLIFSDNLMIEGSCNFTAAVPTLPSMSCGSGALPASNLSTEI